MVCRGGGIGRRARFRSVSARSVGSNPTRGTKKAAVILSEMKNPIHSKSYGHSERQRRIPRTLKIVAY